MTAGRRGERPTLRPRLRLESGGDIALGPGKADLLEALAAAGSIRGAAERLGMSYARAWQLVRTMNDCFSEPLVATERGGGGGGGARVTANGARVLGLYREMERASERAAAPAFARLRRLLAR